MNRTKKISISLLSLLVLIASIPQVEAIPSWNQLQQFIPKATPTPTPVPTLTPSVQNTTSPKEEKVNEENNKINQFKDEINQLRNTNKVKIVSYDGSSEKTVAEIPTFLTFTNNYLQKEKDIIDFNSKDFIYTRFKLPKKISEYLPNPDLESNIEYFRVKLRASSSDYRNVENDNKLSKAEYFKLGYNSNDILIAVVPEKSFFENILMKYKKNGKFISPKKEFDGYEDVLSRNFSRQISEMLKGLPVGIHKVEITFEVTAKLRGGYKQINSAKGAFLINIDEEASEKYGNTYKLLTDLYRDYEKKSSIASQVLFAKSENDMLKKMSPRDQERYKIAKKSPDGYMAAYKGAKGVCTFQFDSVRDKMANIDIIWPDGGTGKEAGSHEFAIFPNFRTEVRNIPIGATVSMNGRILIPKVTGTHNTTIYWYY